MSRAFRWHSSAFRALLRLYPVWFRDTYGEEMEHLFISRLARVRGVSGAAVLWTRVVRDAVATAAHLRRSARARGHARGTSTGCAKGSQHMNALRLDSRLALRALRRSPAYSALVLVTLALAIGSSTTMFALVNTVALRPLPFPAEERLVRVRNAAPSSGGTTRFNMPGAEADLLRGTDGTFAGVVALQGRDGLLRTDAGAERISVVGVSQGWMETLAVAPDRGRLFSAAEYGAGSGSGVAVISHRLWRNRFHGAPPRDMQLSIDDRPYEVVGVFPRGFRFPYIGDVWVPAANETITSAAVFARLNDDVSLREARERVAALAPQIRAAFPQLGPGVTLDLTAARESLIEHEDRTTVALLIVALAFVPIACANVANLLLGRALARRRELAIHAALGASRARQYRQLLIEPLLLSVGGGVAGLLAAAWLAPVLQDLVPSNFVEELAFEGVTLDYRVGMFGMAVSLLIGAAVGLLALARNARVPPREALAGGGRGGTRSRLQHLLVIGQVALALTVLTATGVLVAHVRALADAPLGIDRDQVLSARVQLPASRYASPERRIQFTRLVRDRVSTLPGVVAAGFTSVNPLAGGRSGASIEIDGASPPGEEAAPLVNHRLVTPGLLEALGTPILRGRGITEADADNIDRVAVVSRRMADRLWPGADPLGRRLRLAGQQGPWMTVVGVAADVGDAGELDMTWYLPHAQHASTAAARSLYVMVRSSSDPATLVRPLEAAVHAVERDAGVYAALPLSAVYSETLARESVGAAVSLMFGTVGLLLAAIGVYGVLTIFVSDHRLEFGIRRALGAATRDLIVLVLLRAGRLVGTGLVAGTLVAWAASRLLTAAILNLQGDRAPTFGVALTVLAATSLVASGVPAWRASRVQPTDALRSE
jgi:putative ABC transport system permease protein